MISRAPKIKLFKEHGRHLRLDDEAEGKLFAGSEDPSLWIVSRQEFDRAEPVRLILPVWLEIILAVRSQERQTSSSGSQRQNSRYKNGTTKRCALAFLAVPYRALQSDRCLVNAT
jgi:hypothetical protein